MTTTEQTTLGLPKQSQKQALINAAVQYRAAFKDGIDAKMLAYFDEIFGQALASETPAAEWRVLGEVDPHLGRYDGERAKLMMGDYSDDALANAAFLNYDRMPDLNAVIAGNARMPIAYMTAVKERIRWLSRKVIALIASFGTPVARVDQVHMSRGAVEWINGSLPEGTLLYALPPVQEQPNKT